MASSNKALGEFVADVVFGFTKQILRQIGFG